MSKSQFRDDLEHIINCQSMENGSDTPDFILADYLLSCLETYDLAVRRREDWYGRAPVPVQESPTTSKDNIVRDFEGRAIGVKGNDGPS